MEPKVWIIVLPPPRHVATPLSRLARGAHYRAYFRVDKWSVMSDFHVQFEAKKQIHPSGSPRGLAEIGVGRGRSWSPTLVAT